MLIPINVKNFSSLIKGTEKTLGTNSNTVVPTTSWPKHSTVPQVLATAHSFRLNVFCLSETPGDGNCFYRAIIEQIRDRSDLGDMTRLRLRFSNHHILRQSVVEFVRSQSELDQPPYYVSHYKTLFEGGVLDIPGARGFTWDELLNQQARDTIYATELFIKATAVMLGKDICVNSPSCDINSPFNRISCFWDRQLQFDANMTLSAYLLLASVNNNHFQSLLPGIEGLFANSANSDNFNNIDFTIEPRGLKRKGTDSSSIESQGLKKKKVVDAGSSDHGEGTDKTE